VYRTLPRSTRRNRCPQAFSLVELVIVVTIIGIIASIAVPRISSVAANSKANALQASVASVRKAIDIYFAEHGRYPGYDPSNGTPSGPKFVDQLLKFTDEKGNPSDTMGGEFVYGPYLRPPFPKNPANGLATVFVKATPGAANPANGAFGWVAVLSHG
jgi:prepilin-type N-terminal cleavage/methylation domain-containing protein